MDAKANSQSQTRRDELKSVERLARYACLIIFVLIILFGLSQSIVSVPAIEPTKAATTILDWVLLLKSLVLSFAIVFAAAAIGCLLGFLFGIPKSLQISRSGNNPPPAGEHAGQNAVSAQNGTSKFGGFANNTSLEEISDWLTKIIIGLGLVQFETFLTKLNSISIYTAAFLASKEIPQPITFDAKLSSPYFFALIIVGLISGCIFAYLETRTRLKLLFVGTEQQVNDHTRELENSRDTNVAELDLTVSKPDALKATPARAEDTAVTNIPWSELKTPAEIVGWAAAQARTGNLPLAEDALRDALKKSPTDPDIYLKIADVKQLRQDYDGAVKMRIQASRYITDEDKRIDLLRRSIYAALFVAPPHGFDQAISLSEELLELPRGRNALSYLWLACGLGQKFGHLQANRAPASEINSVREKALAAVRKVVELAPNYDSSERMLLRAVFDPQDEGNIASDNDLEVFKNDADFRTVIYQGKP